MNFSYSPNDHTKLLSLFAKAIDKGIGRDIKDTLADNNKETNNAIKFVPGDNINTNLKIALTASTTAVSLHPFRRCSWDGRIIVDYNNQLTYSIHSKKSFNTIRHKFHNSKKDTQPHYLPTIIAIENKDIKPLNEQLLLINFDLDIPFSKEDFIKDYIDILGKNDKISPEFHHLVITYSNNKGKLESLDLLILAYDMSIVEEFSLMNLVQPDFMELTENTNPDSVTSNNNNEDTQTQPEEETSTALVKLKVASVAK